MVKLFNWVEMIRRYQRYNEKKILEFYISLDDSII